MLMVAPPLRRVVCRGAGGRQALFRGIDPYNVAPCGNVVEPRAPGCGARVLSRRIRGTRNRAQHLRSAHARGMVPATFSQGQLTPGGGGFAAERIGLDSVVTQAALCGCGRDHGCTGLWPWLNSQGHKVRTKFPSVGFSPAEGNRRSGGHCLTVRQRGPYPAGCELPRCDLRAS